MQGAYHSEKSPNNTGLIIFIVHSRLHFFKSIKYIIFNPKTRKLLNFFSLSKFKIVFLV